MYSVEVRALIHPWLARGPQGATHGGSFGPITTSGCPINSAN